MCNILFDSAQRTLPHVRQSQTQRWNDSTLTTLCSESRQARKASKEAGTTAEGPIYDEKCRLRRAVGKRIRFCAAQAENRRIQRRSNLYPIIICVFVLITAKERFIQNSSSMDRSSRIHHCCWMPGLSTMRIFRSPREKSYLCCRSSNHTLVTLTCNPTVITTPSLMCLSHLKRSRMC